MTNAARPPLSTIECLRIVRDALREASPTGNATMMQAEDPLPLLRRKVLPQVIGVSDGDRDTVIMRALRAAHEDIDRTADTSGLRTDKPRLKAAIRRMIGLTQAADSKLGTRQDALAAAIAGPSTTATAAAMTNLAEAVRRKDQPSADQHPPGADTAKDERPSGQGSHRPFQASRIDERALAGMDIMISRATNGQITKATELFRRLATAEAMVEAMRGEDQAPLEQTSRTMPGEPTITDDGGTGTTYRWTAAVAKVEDVFPKDAIFNNTLTENAQAKVDATRLLAQEVTLWQTTKHPSVPRIDHGYRFDAKTLAMALHAMRTGRNLCIVGPTGSGKTKFLEQFAARLGRPYFRISVDGEMRRREIIGGLQQVVTPNGSMTAWFDGLLTVGIQLPSVVNLDEIDRADADMLYAASQALERNGIQLLEDGNRRIPMNPACMIASTGNTKGQADANGLYATTSEMSEASRDRLSIYVDHGYMDNNTEVAMLMDKVPGIKKDDAKVIVEVASDIRLAMADGRLRSACSHRTTTATAEYLTDMMPLLSGSPKERRIECLNDVLSRRARDEHDAKAISQLIRNRVSGGP